MKYIFLSIAFLSLVGLSQSLSAEELSSKSEHRYSHEFTVNGTKFKVEIIHVSGAGNIVVSNNYVYGISLTELSTSQSYSADSHGASAWKCNSGPYIYLLTTTTSDFEEHVKVDCGDRVILTGVRSDI